MLVSCSFSGDIQAWDDLFERELMRNERRANDTMSLVNQLIGMFLIGSDSAIERSFAFELVDISDMAGVQNRDCELPTGHSGCALCR